MSNNVSFFNKAGFVETYFLKNYNKTNSSQLDWVVYSMVDFPDGSNGPLVLRG